jgi:hypothetical protein
MQCDNAGLKNSSILTANNIGERSQSFFVGTLHVFRKQLVRTSTRTLSTVNQIFLVSLRSPCQILGYYTTIGHGHFLPYSLVFIQNLETEDYEVFFFFFFRVSRRNLGPIYSAVRWVPGAISPEINRPGGEVDRSTSSYAEVKNAWSYTSTPP